MEVFKVRVYFFEGETLEKVKDVERDDNKENDGVENTFDFLNFDSGVLVFLRFYSRFFCLLSRQFQLYHFSRFFFLSQGE